MPLLDDALNNYNSVERQVEGPMSVSILLLIGIILVLFIIFNRGNLFKLVGTKKLEVFLNKRKWFRNPWLVGLMIFGINAVLFGVTALLLFVLTQYMIPFMHIVIMVVAVVVSITAWIFIGGNWVGSKPDRYKMGLVGSGFYAILASLFIYKWITLTPAFPGDDTFMAAIGLVFGIIVSTVAFITCFCFTTYSPRNFFG